MDFSETIVVFDIKVGRCGQLNVYMKLMNINGQGHSLTFDDGHPISTFQGFFSLETARPIEAKFHVEPPWNRETKACSNGLGHMTKMAAIPIYDKNL